MFEELCAKITELSGMPCRESTVIRGGVKLQSISIGEGKIVPTVYPQNFPDMPLEDLAKKLIETVNDHKPSDDMMDQVENIREWEWAKDHLLLCIRPYIATNDHVTREFLDLQEYVRVVLSDNASATVTNGLLKSWGVTEKEVFDRATTGKNRMISMMKMFLEIASGDVLDDVSDLDDNGMYVITNNERFNASNAMLDQKMLKRIFDKIGDFYILPSSIHELIVLPKVDGADPKELKAMVQAVNGEQVAPEERLSDSVYVYTEGLLQIAA